jgi:hypothetical protein
MKAHEWMRTIESVPFSVGLNVVSGLRTFLSAAASQEAVQGLQEELSTTNGWGELAARITSLCARPTDPNSENPADTALAVYLWLLGQHEVELARQAAALALQVPNLWWTYQVAQPLVREDGARPIAPGSPPAPGTPWPAPVGTTGDQGGG